MKKNSQKCKGARDLLPKDMINFRYIEKCFTNLCQKWGYKEVRTPTLEYIHLFTSSGTLTPSMLSKVYSFLDWDGWSGERVVLRPDGTIPVARLYLENLAKQKIAKLFYVNNVFSFESTGKENRERWQAGIEYIGNNESWAELEIIKLALDILRKIGINNIQVQLSHAGIIKSLIEHLKLEHEKEEEILNQIRRGNWNILTKISSENGNINRIISILINTKGKNTNYLENIKSIPHIPHILKKNIDNLVSITKLLDYLDICYQTDITSTTDFEYYTGSCFQFFTNDILVGAGGRYNNLIPLMGGNETPACGAALYIDQLMKLVPQKTQFNGRISVTPPLKSNKKTISLCFKLIKFLHDSGFQAELGFSQNKQKYNYIVNIEFETETLTILNNSNKKLYKVKSMEDMLELIRRNN